MIFRRFLTISALVLWIGAGFAAPKAPPADEAILRAYDAFKAGDPGKLQRAAAQLGGNVGVHVLAPYLEYWRLKIRLEEMPEADVRAFLQAQAGSYLADRLRADWLKVLGNRSDWQSFERELPALVQDDPDIRCFAWLARLARSDDGAFEEAKAIWLEPRELPESCHAFANKMIEAGRINVDDVWRRLRVLFDNGQINPARRALVHLPASEKFDEKLFNLAATAPKKLLASPPKSFEPRATREMVLFAVVRLARTEPEAAAEFLRGKLGARLSAEDMKYLWGRVAYEGARRLLPEAHLWYALADVA